MARPSRTIPIVLAPFLVAVALLGYLAGYHRRGAVAGAPAAGTSRVVAVGSALVEYPAVWHPISPGPMIPGLALDHRIALAPSSGTAAGGLLVGDLPDGEPAPLSRSLQAVLGGPPSTEVVNLPGFQAYRYAGLQIRGYGATVVLYAIPSPGAAPTGLACFAAAGASAVLRECERIVARVSLIGQTQYDLSPDVGYARRLGGQISGLDRERIALRRAMRATPSAVAAAAATLSGRFAAVATSLAALEPPLAAVSAQAALAASIRAARDAYAQLASDARLPGGLSADAARASVASSEAGVDAALMDFALLGYARSTAAGGG